jgi:hypothetical protein
MGIVAMDTALFIHEGPMDPVLAECIIDHRTMALTAQLVSNLLCRKWLRGGWVFVALITHLIGDRPVNIREQHSSSVGTMRIVAARAAGFCHRIIHVLFLERGRSRLMTFKAERWYFVL